MKGRIKDATIKERDDAMKRITSSSNTNNENTDPTVSKHAKIELDELNQLLDKYSNGSIIIIIIITIIIITSIIIITITIIIIIIIIIILLI